MAQHHYISCSSLIYLDLLPQITVTQSGTILVNSENNRVCSTFSLFQYQCLCKPNVVGRTCDRCMHGFYNFSASNPLGCSSCGCSPRGTVSGTRHCHVQSGRCDCKTHVIGKKCENCQNGYHGMRSQDIFGCKGEMLIYLQRNVSTLSQK